MANDDKSTESSKLDCLRECDDSFRLIFENNPLPMWVYDQESLAFFAVNQAAIDHYGYTRECYLSMTIRDIRPDSDIPHLEQFIARYGPHLRKAGCWRHRKQDGTLIEVEIVTHDLQFNQRPARLFLVYDVTK